MIVDKLDGIKEMRRAVYYASQGVRTAYLKYDGSHRDNVYDLIQMLDNLYIALKKEESPQYER